MRGRQRWVVMWRSILLALRAAWLLAGGGRPRSRNAPLIRIACTPSPHTHAESNEKLKSSGEHSVVVILGGNSSAGSGSRRELWRRIVLALKVKVCRLFNERKGYTPITITAQTPAQSPTAGIVEIRSVPSQVSLSVHSGNIELPHENIASIVKKRDLSSLRELGGVQGIAEALKTDLSNGLPGGREDPGLRYAASLRCKTKALACSFCHSLLKASNNLIIVLLLLSAVLSLCFGVQEEGPQTGWRTGVMIIAAVLILLLVSSIRNFWYENAPWSPERQKLSKEKEIVVSVLRGGCQQQISITDVSVGEVVVLEKGCKVPADGLLISSDYLELDDGSKCVINNENPFLFHGAKVSNGNGSMLVTSVGLNTTWGEMMSKLTHAPNKTPLQTQLDKVNARTQVIGLLISIINLIVLYVRFKLGKENDESGNPDFKGKLTPVEEFMEAVKNLMKQKVNFNFLTTSLIMLVVGIVEGFPFIIMVAITYWNKKMSNKAFAQHPLACVDMGSVTTICTDRLTSHPPEVDTCYIGEEYIMEDSDSAKLANVGEALRNGISTPILSPQSPRCSTKDPLCTWARKNLGMDMEILEQEQEILEAKELNSNEEGSGVCVRMKKDDKTNIFSHWKGPAKTILAMCSHYYDSAGETNEMDEDKRMAFEEAIGHMQSKHLKTVAYAFKQIDIPKLEGNNLILIGLVGLRDTYWPEVRKAMEACRTSGVDIILISEDNVAALEATAQNAGILGPNSYARVLKGENFRNCTNEERLNMVNQISVIGNSNPHDRLLLVECLKQKGHIVAVIGFGTNETPALKEADVGLAIRTLSTETVVEISDIVLYNGDFSFLPTILQGGRCLYGNIRKFIQLELIMIIAGMLTNPVVILSLGDLPMTSIQFLYANLVVPVLGGFALLTEPPTEEQMKKGPICLSEPLISKMMLRNIAIQALSQAAILVTFQCKGQAMLSINQKVKQIMIFNIFVLYQVFNMFNARELEKKNIFKGMHQNHWLWVGVFTIVAFQLAFIEIAHRVAGNATLNCKQWIICFLISMVSMVMDCAGKFTWGFISDHLMIPSTPSESVFDLELQKSVSNLALPESVSNIELCQTSTHRRPTHRIPS
ncbi:putative calcium-transporting ATPase 13, plasma membrane-type [Malania oleifera]|uniref:putative calcium-transporting ATPase 13, plasma membrane-type n=1 Tax=Malania oleifera TaxID=397392 RepID=UPI0025AE94B9|nr:putative calcium-transporting ATPase 13, plasma membrane-type [Malania oleifera]